jgi:hypothetical protein
MAKSDMEREAERWGTIAQALVDSQPGRKDYYDETIEETIEEMRTKMPNADDETLVIFAQSIAYIMLSVMSAKVEQLSSVVTNAFDVYSLVTATLLGAYEPGGAPVPEGTTGAPHDGLKVVEHEPAPEDTPKRAGEPDVTYGLYL